MNRIITTFIEDNWKRTLYIKGAWGIGKTRYIKDLMKSDGIAQSHPFAYASLAGISSIDNLKRRLLSNIIVSEKGIFSKIDNKVRPFVWAIIDNMDTLQAMLPKEVKALNIKKIADSLIDPSIKNFSFIIILDDLEKCKLQNFDELYSFISFIKESTECKLILVGNDKASVEKSQASGCTTPLRFSLDLKENKEWKDKIVDMELEFKLSIDDICGVYNTTSEVRLAMERILASNNTRDLRKIRKAIDSSVAISELSSKDVKAEVAQLIFEYSLKYLIEQPQEASNEATMTMSGDHTLEMYAIKFLDEGAIYQSDKQPILDAIERLKFRTNRKVQFEAIEAVRDLVFYTFIQRDELIARIKEVIQNVSDLSFSDLVNFKIFLENYDLYDDSFASEFDGKIKSQVDLLSEEDVDSIMSYAFHEKVKNEIRQLRPVSYSTSIINIAKQFRRSQQRAFEALRNLDIQQSVNELSNSADKEVVINLTTMHLYLQSLSSNQKQFLDSLNVLNQILDELENVSEINKQRVAMIREHRN